MHGLPISLKDQFHVKNVDTTMGYVGWIGENLGVSPEQTHRTESQVVTELVSLGAVLYCKTSLPQTLLVSQCSLSTKQRRPSKLTTLSAGGNNQQYYRPDHEPSQHALILWWFFGWRGCVTRPPWKLCRLRDRYWYTQAWVPLNETILTE